MKFVKHQDIINHTFPREHILSIEVISSSLTHPDFKLDDDWNLNIRDQFARSDETQFRSVRMSKFFLPPTAIHSRPMPLITRPLLAGYCVLAAECYYRQLPGLSKSSMDNTVFIPIVLAKFFEYCWLEGIYDPTTVTAELVDRLTILLSEGGWALALRVEQRLKLFVEACPADVLQSFAKTKELKRSEKTPLLVQNIISALGTNLSAKELQPCLAVMFDALGLKMSADQKRRPLPPTRTMLKQYLDPLNLLARLPGQFAFSAPLVPNPYQSAKRVARAGSRTRNLSVENVALLVSRALFWVDHVGPVVCDGLEELALDMLSRKANGNKWLGLGAPKIAKRIYRNLAELLGDEAEHFSDLGNGRKLSYELAKLITSLQVACFVLIGAMNARRRDEISGRRIGLHRYALEKVDVELGIYQAYFYVEKTYRGYMPFYVNAATARAIKLLERIYDAYDWVDECHGRRQSEVTPEEATLFSIRSFNNLDGFNAKPSWFSIDDAVRTGRFAVFRGADTPAKFNAHALRRFYAIFFYYRYENGTLHGLMYQLGHSNLGSVLTYITDPKGRPEMEKIAQALKPNLCDRKAAFEIHCSDIEESLREVGAEKLRNNIENALRGEASGGYAKYIRRLDVKLAQSVEFDSVGWSDRVDRLTKRVIAAGHWPTPMHHGDCMAGGKAPWGLAHCADKENAKLRTENAGPITCGTCAWHQANLGNVRNLEEDLATLEEKILVEQNIIVKVRAERDVVNLKRVVALHRSRITSVSLDGRGMA